MCRNCRCRQCSFGTVLICKYIKRYKIYRIVHVFVQHICQSSSVLPCVLLENHHILLEGPVIWNAKMVEQVGEWNLWLSSAERSHPHGSPGRDPSPTDPSQEFLCLWGVWDYIPQGMWAKIIDAKVLGILNGDPKANQKRVFDARNPRVIESDSWMSQEVSKWFVNGL